jgi:hypothetical protein
MLEQLSITLNALDWQTSVALAIVAIAVAVLFRQAFRFVSGTGKSSCSSCPSKSNGTPIKAIPLVQLSSPARVKASDDTPKSA